MAVQLTPVKTTSSKLSSTKEQALNVIIRKNQTKLELARYLHGCLFSPVKATLLKAIKNGHFLSWDGLSEELINKHLPVVEATVLGHQKQEKQGLQSTTRPSNTYSEKLKTIREKYKKLMATKRNKESLQDVLTKEILEDAFPPSPSPNTRSNEVIYSLLAEEDVHGACFDFTALEDSLKDPPVEINIILLDIIGTPTT